jgi:outer membrane protein TolC
MGQMNRELLPNPNFSPVNHISYKLFETQEKLQVLGLKREQSLYLPTLSAFYTYQKNAMRSEFNVFEGGQDWYPTSIVGLNLSIPIFSSGMRYFKVQQAKLNLMKMRINKEQIGQGLMLEAEAARITYNNAVETYLTDTRNKELSSSIYDKSLKKFKEGLISSTELTTIQNQYLSSLNSYYGSVYKLLEAKTKYDKSINQF